MRSIDFSNIPASIPAASITPLKKIYKRSA